jgi:signal transduction histidine kinase
MEQQTLQKRILDLENRVSILQQLAEISASLNSQVSLKTLLNHIMDVAVQISDCEAASVLLWDESRQQLVFAASTTAAHDGNDLIGKAVPMDSIAGRVFQENKTEQINDVREDPQHYEKTTEDIDFETHSLLGVPMTYKNNVIGVLEALNKRTMPWTGNDRNYLAIIAAQAAVAIEGVKLVSDLRRVNQDLSEVDKLKNDFIAIASHELRTPLGVIMGYASFLQEEESESTKEHAGKVLESALRLRKIIEDMVNLRYLKQNQADLHLDNVHISALLGMVKQELFSLMDLNDYTFNYSLPSEDVLMRIDQTRLIMALTNLMHNAISFTEPGGTITLEAEMVSKHEIHIRVKDSGKGIGQEELIKIFEEFYQVEDHMVRHHGGLGIGLSIARAIVHAHNGRIWAESDGANKGATFVIALRTTDAGLL